MIEIKKLQKKYTSFELNLPSLFFEEGLIYGIIGNNGCGKTTLLESMLNLIKIDNGSITYRKENHLNGEWKKYTNAFIGNNFLIDFLTAKEYFEFIFSTQSSQITNLVDPITDYSKFIGKDIVEGYSKKLIREYSEGNKKKIGIIGTLITNPDIVFLDEPFVNLDPSSQLILSKEIQNVNTKCKTTFIITSHNLEYVNEISDEIILLKEGKLSRKISEGDFSLNELKGFFR